jgi:NAD(P)-dependent dehydrogenase (short-subunit alcohol dehydrogenase family)
MNRTVVITGSASGIGKACADLAEERGWRPIRVDLREGDIAADLSRPEGRDTMIRKCAELSGGTLDAVIACAGVAIDNGQLAIPVNYFGMVATLGGLRPLLAQGAQPRAVGIASWAALMSPDAALVEACLRGDEAAVLAQTRTTTDPQVLYPASKAALARWVRRNAVTKEWAGAGILLNAIAPGLVRTPMVASITGDASARAALAQHMPMPIGRDAEPREMAELLLWLASPANSMIVGQVLFADGGAEASVRGDQRF